MMSILSTTTARRSLLHNSHPGEILAGEFMKPMGITQNGLARALAVPPRRINEIVLGKRAITADTGLRLARYFGLLPRPADRFRVVGAAPEDCEGTTSLAAYRTASTARTLPP